MRHPSSPTDRFYFNVHETAEILGFHRKTFDREAVLNKDYIKSNDDGRNYTLNFYTPEFIIAFAQKRFKRGDTLKMYNIEKLGIPEVTELFEKFNSSQEVPLEGNMYNGDKTNEQFNRTEYNSDEQNNRTDDTRLMVAMSMIQEKDLRINELSESKEIYKNLYEEIRYENQKIVEENKKLEKVNFNLIIGYQKKSFIFSVIGISGGVLVSFVSWYIIHFQLIG